MSLVTRVLGGEKRSLNATDWLLRYLGGPMTATGRWVNVDNAISNPNVGSCIRLLCDTISSLPLITYRRLPEGGKERAVNHPLFPLLHDLPNPELTSAELRSIFVGHLNTWGNAYGNIVWSNGGKPLEIWPLRPDNMTVKRDKVTERLYYEYRVHNEETRILQREEVLHVRGQIGRDGIYGMSPIRQYAESLGLTMAAEEYGARFFGNNGNPGGILTHPGKLSQEAQDRLKATWEDKHRGLLQAHRIAVLEEGLTWQQVGLPPEAAQFLQTREFQLGDTCRIFRVPPHMLYHMARATWANVEQMEVEFLTYSIHPWLVRFEQAFYRDLLLPSERATIYVEHLVDGLLRGDSLSRNQAYAIARNNGWMTADEIRDRENLNPLPDGQGKLVLVPMNMVSAASVAANPTPTTGAGLPVAAQRAAVLAGPTWRSVDSGARNRQRIAASYRGLFSEAGDRIIRREQERVLKQAERLLTRSYRDSGELLSWLDTFYAEHNDYVSKQLTPILVSMADAIQVAAADEVSAEPDGASLSGFLDGFATVAALDWSDTSHYQLAEVIGRAKEVDGDVLSALAARFDLWGERRAGQLADLESVRGANAVAKETWRLAGITEIRWVAIGKNCAFCAGLNGKVAGIEKHFVKAGQDYLPDGADQALRPGRDVGHAPLHEACDCQVAAQR